MEMMMMLVLALATALPAVAQEPVRQPASKADIVDCLSTMEVNAKNAYMVSNGLPAPGLHRSSKCTADIMLSMPAEKAQPFMDVVSLYTVAITNPSMISYTQFTTAAMQYANGL